MNICMISQDFAPAIGGVAAHVDNLSKALAKQGNRVTVVTVRYDLQTPFRTLDGNREVLRFWVPNVSKVRGLSFILQAIPFLFLAPLFKRFKIIHWHNILPDSLISAFVPRGRGVFTNHTSTFLEIYSANRRRGLFRLLLKRAKKMIGPSKELAEKSQIFFGRPQADVHYIPNGVDTDNFLPLPEEAVIAARRQWLSARSLPESTRIIFCPRRLEPKNGVDLAVKAMPAILEKFPAAILVVAGNDAVQQYADSVRALIAELGLKDKVFLLGPVANADMPLLHSLADVALLPSLMEATSIAGLEAMACGAPLVGSRVGGIPDLIEEGATGLLVPPNDPAALAAAVSRILGDGALRKAMSLAARRKAEAEFSWDNIAKRTAMVYIEP